MWTWMGRQTTIWIIGGLAMFGFGWLLGTPSRVSDTPRQVRSHPSVAPPNDQLANASTEQLLSQLSAPSPAGWLEETWRRLLLSRLAESDQTAIAQLSEEEQKLAHAIRISNDPLSQWHTTDRTAQEPHEYRHLLEALSKADPIAFLDITSDKTVTITGSIDWDSIYRHLFSESLQKALDYHESHRQLRTTNSFLKRWSERDPSAAWEWLGTSGLANSHHQLAILENWFQKDFARASERLTAMSGYSSGFTPGIVKALLQLPADRTGHLYEQHLGGLVSNERARVASFLARSDLRRATAFINGLANDHRQDTALRFLADAPVHDMEALSDWIASDAMSPIADQAADQLAKNLIRSLGPSQRQSIAAEIPAGHPLATAIQRAEHALNEALSGDPKTYADWIRKETYAEIIDIQVLERLSDSPPERRLDFLAVASVRHHGYLANALKDLSLTDTDTATHWALAQSDLELKETALGAIASALTSHHLDTAFEWMEHLPDAPAKSIAKNAVLSQWADSDPEAAATWIRGQAASQPELAGILVEAWARRDPVEVSAWLSEQPIGSSKDYGIAAFVRAYNEPDHAKEVLTWAVTIQDAEQRRALLLETFQTWQSMPELIEQGLVFPHLDPKDAAAIRKAADRNFEAPHQ